ncbi:DUF3581 domain-containing protein [Shewanella indica]|uniref:DUF3581 domain-containing protein n=1 Tax=Shewanella indica TaxID=768528 RepID=UPI001CFED28B|nr:DUF3581 domain-containing protein [Shewanella indica]
MFLVDYFKRENNQITIGRKQASDFAKGVAGDFNPIHDEDAKRFCVPGDLLFALVLNDYGLSRRMLFKFEGMVGDGVCLHFPGDQGAELAIEDERGKRYLNVHREGETRHCERQLESFVRSYVAFSGLNFTHVLVPLMREHQVTINPARPLVIYESMGFELDTLEFEQVKLELINCNLKVDGKRGDVTLDFALISDDKQVGTGRKTLVLSGLRPFDEAAVEAMVSEYQARRDGSWNGGGSQTNA